MKYTKLNANWDVAPDASGTQTTVTGHTLELVFDLDPVFAHIDEGDRGTLEFVEVYAYKLWEITREDYLNGKFRFKKDRLPWGGFYELPVSGRKEDFPSDIVVVDESLKETGLTHYIFFLPGQVLECWASDYYFHFDYRVSAKLEELYPKGYFNHYLAIFSAHFNQMNTDNYKVYTNLYIQLEGKKEFEGLKEELKKIKANKDLDSYVKIANYRILNLTGKQLDEMIKVIETYDAKSKYA
ncbi:hypothetical protein [Fluviicola chungangensis]|uniref:Uncharacterized protein n=1 Tax=Fluviicola chungangensis TaxID=2597671 RepID=A0A556N745_9FLAO|nr:hypothetical protein [Fluviicola chungangensis]TSJ47941.1 hypothetical protein FO442_02070 [Fluviicola chungangensis]